MKRLRPKQFIALALGLALLLALAIAPFASKLPDGLERVAQNLGFAGKAEEQSSSQAPAADYNIPGVKHSGASTALAGLAGTLLVFGLGFGLERLLRRRAHSDSPAADGGSHPA